MEKFFYFWQIFLDFIFPQTEEVAKLEKMTPEEFVTIVPSAEKPEVDFATAFFDYQYPLVRLAVRQIKFKNNRTIAKLISESFYGHLLEELAELSQFENFHSPILIPLPISGKRKRQRGYNQSEIIGENLSRLDNGRNFVYEPKILLKVRDTPSQTSVKNRQNRLKNLSGCFAVAGKVNIRGKNVILLDDVTTTGATLKEARKVLLKNSAKKIFAFTVAH